MNQPPSWIGLAGPTASGKTDVALAMAREWPIEIISVDSALVYRGMDIGTAKPSAAERALVPHHLIDIIDPVQSYSAARFVQDAQQLMGQIRERGRLPLLVGGTMLYFKALMDGLDPLPAADPLVRQRLDEELTLSGLPALHARLAQVDPEIAQRLAPGDSQRILRALEVWELTGQPLSSLQSRSKGGPAAKGESASGLVIALEPSDRAWLHRRIESRFQAMWEQGFLQEVLALRSRGGLTPDMPSVRCVGYRQAWEALDAGLAGDALRQDVLTRGAAATRQLAKRQLTWLRSLPRIPVIADRPNAAELVSNLIRVKLAAE